MRAPPATFAELQPLLAEKGVALATDTQDYMIPIAVDANQMRDRLGMAGAIAAFILSIIRRRVCDPAGGGTVPRPQQVSSN